MAEGNETDKNIEIWEINKLIKALEKVQLKVVPQHLHLNGLSTESTPLLYEVNHHLPIVFRMVSAPKKTERFLVSQTALALPGYIIETP
ncbi:hypothetical protein QJS10_CPA10g00418 [Acorus calamus]|uniref:Uncharacterized protein n=1 Tax=Acorus calamus TaxID=4465 RepID=A0AAV9DWL4_ACOCL|nr:hypothetical protein QJS10_CPA10g00418 [Acorus calamus]